MQVIDTLGRDIFTLEREYESAKLETDIVIAQICGQIGRPVADRLTALVRAWG